MDLRAWAISGVSVWTTMPSATGVVQAVWSLGHLLDAHDAHAAGSLEREPGVVTEGRDIDAGGLAGLDEQGARGGGYFLSVYGKGYVWHVLGSYAAVSVWGTDTGIGMGSHWTT